MKKYSSLLVAPLAVALLAALVFILGRLYPFGPNTLSWCDMSQQVIPILLQFKDILAGLDGIFLNMSSAGGMNFWGVFLFFIASPFSFLVAFIEKADLMLAINVIVVLKMMVCGFTATLFFRRCFPRLGDVFQIMLGVAYAFCGYTMLFYQNIVWLDMMYLFPLLLLALKCLLEKQKLLPFVLALSGMLVVNFYLSYMVVIFILLATGLYLLLCCKQENRRQCVVLLGIGTLISALLTAVVWLPAFDQYLSSARGVSLIASLASGNFFTQLYTTLPFLFCTGILFAAIPTVAKRMGKNPQIKFLLWLFLLLLIPVLIDPINKMWHTGSYQAFPLRYGYMTIFIGLILCAAFLSRLKEKTGVRTNRGAVIPIFFNILAIYTVGLTMILGDKNRLNSYTKTLWGDLTSFLYLLFYFLISLVCYLLCFYLFKKRHITKRVLTVALCLLVAGECLFNGGVYMGTAANDVTTYRQTVDLGNKIEDDQFYRVKMQKKYFDVNLLGGIGYPTLNHYTSLNSESYLFTLKTLGYSSYWMEVGSQGGTVFTDALLSNNYTITRNPEANLSNDIVYSNQSYHIIKNKFRLPLGLIIPGNVAQTPDLPVLMGRAQMQEYLFHNLFQSDDTLLTEYWYSNIQNLTYQDRGRYELTRNNPKFKGVLEYSVPVQGQQVLYFDCFDQLSNRLKEAINDSFRVIINGKILEERYPNQKNNGILNLGTFTDETVAIRIEVLKDIEAKSFGVYGLDPDVLENGLSSAASVDVSVENNQLSANCTASEGEFLYLSLPYDKGFTATVNGEKVKIERTYGTFFSIPLQAGENEIRLSFLPRGFGFASILSIAGLILLAGVLLLKKKKGYAPFAILERFCYPPFWILVGGVAAAVYIFPLLVYCFVY